MANNIVSEKKKALVARKEKLLQDIQYYERRIADFHANKSATSFYEDNCSSDSDGDFPIIDNGPSVTQLKLQQSHLKTSLQATQELTNLHLLEHEVNIMVTDPIIVDEPQVREPGVWKEVIVECRLDLIPFSITFHIHRPSVKFGAPSYRNLKVILTKPAHETELANSVLAHVTTPSDAIEVLRSYSAAHRSRRSTLARLAEKFPNLLFMEPLAEGGYILKCAGLLEVCWTLQNKWSPIAPFHHRMRFDLEYMDESYIKIITQFHRQLSDPSLETDERTTLLSKIIKTCLEAKGPTQELYESMESDDPEAAQTLRQRRMTLDQEVTETAPKRKRDDGIMAPPKSLPKKSKPKGKENKVQGNEERELSKVRADDNDVTNASGRDSVVSGKSKDSRKDGQSIKEGDNRKENAKFTKDLSERNENSKAAKEISDNGKDNIKSTKKVSNIEKENAKPAKDTDKRKDQKSAKETYGRKDTAPKSKENATVKENSEARNSVAKLTKVMDKKDCVAKPKENIEVKNSVAKSIKEVSDGKSSHRIVKDSNNLKESDEKITKKVDEDVNSMDVARNKAPKQSNKDKNLEGDKKNSAKVSKKSIVPKKNKNVNEEIDGEAQKDKGEVIETNSGKVNSDKGMSKTKVNSNTNNTDTNKKNYNIERSVPKKVKKTDDIANIPAKKAKIDQTRKNTDSNVKTTENPKKSSNNIQLAKNVQKNNVVNQNNARTKGDAGKKDLMYTKSSENIKKLTEKNKMVITEPNLTEPNLAERTDNPQKSPKNIKSVTKNSNTITKNPIESMTIHDKVKNAEQNMKKAKNTITNLRDKIKSVKTNIENNKHLNNGKPSQKFKVSTGNTKPNSVKKLSAGNTVKETSTESKVSKIPQSLTKVANTLKKNPLRISPRKLSSNLKSGTSVKKTIQKPITSIPRFLKKPVVKT